jgi:hypothetical protein
MKNVINLRVPLVAALLIGGTAYATAHTRRPVMPEFVVDVRTSDTDNLSPPLMLIYSEEGSDPFLGGPLGPGRRIANCNTVGSLCVTRAARKEFGTIQNRPQSLQVRLANGNGNPIVGGVPWTGSWHPRQVRVICDLRVSDARQSCAVIEVKP